MDADERAYRRDMRRLATRASELVTAALEGRLWFEVEREWNPGAEESLIERVRVVVDPRRDTE